MPYSVYLFGLLTNQWCIEGAFPSSRVDLVADTAMIVRIDDESKRTVHAFTVAVAVAVAVTLDDQRDPPVVATERFRSSPAPQPHLAGGPCQGDWPVEADHV